MLRALPYHRQQALLTQNPASHDDHLGREHQHELRTELAQVVRLYRPLRQLRALAGTLILIGTLLLTAVCVNLYFARSLGSATWGEILLQLFWLLVVLGSFALVYMAVSALWGASELQEIIGLVRSRMAPYRAEAVPVELK